MGNPESGIFVVKEDGVYQLTFTAFSASFYGQMVSVEIYQNRRGQNKILGRGSSSSKTRQEKKPIQLYNTISVVLQERLAANDKIFVSMSLSGRNWNSKLDSDFSRKI